MRKLSATITIAFAVAAAALPPASASAGSGGAAVINAHRTRLGTILVNSRGYTLYDFTSDRHGRDVCISISQCLVAWPAVTSTGRPIAGPGVKQSLLGTTLLRKGVEQVTYAGHPLYTYASDTQPAQTTNINILQFGGYWPALAPSGREIK